MKVGETIEINGVMLEAIAEISEDSCKGCFFKSKKICPKDEDENLLCTKDDIIIFKKK